MVIENKFFELRINTKCGCGWEDCSGWDYFCFDSKLLVFRIFRDWDMFFQLFIGGKHVYSNNLGWFYKD
jgi:hypothetical protein